MSIFSSAGHNPFGKKTDPGAIGNGYREADLTIQLRDQINLELIKLGSKVITDKDSQTLAEYIGSIKPGSGSVVCEVHFNAGTPTATGVEVLYPIGASEANKKLAKDVSAVISLITGLRDRGAKDEGQSHRGRLGILHTGAGISILPEICFISNKSDLEAYFRHLPAIAKAIAGLLKQADDLYS